MVASRGGRGKTGEDGGGIESYLQLRALEVASGRERKIEPDEKGSALSMARVGEMRNWETSESLWNGFIGRTPEDMWI